MEPKVLALPHPKSVSWEIHKTQIPKIRKLGKVTFIGGVLWEDYEVEINM